MPAERYYYPENFKKGMSIVIRDRECHHLVHVMRSEAGKKVEVVNGKGELAHAYVKQIKKKHAELIVEKIISEPKPPYELTLMQAIPRLNRLDTILEKATELGATQISLFPGMLSERKKLSDDQLKRSKSVLISALKQCGRLWLPELQYLSAIENWKPFTTPCFFGDLSHDSPPLLESLHNLKTKNRYQIVIGPESGFTGDEEKSLKSLNAQGTKLHQNILRTDTASIVSLGLLSHHLLCQNF